VCLPHSVQKAPDIQAVTGPYYPLRTIGTVPRAYNIFRAYEGMEGRKNKNKEMKSRRI
jgi:hypothetical protein